MNDVLGAVLGQIETANAKHGKRLRQRISGMGPEFQAEAERHFSACHKALQGEGKSIDFAVRCYLKMWEDMEGERINFLRSGKYSNTSYREVEQAVYSRPEVMVHHMHGLALAQYLWLEQYERLKFFRQTLPEYRERTRSYLEIGGGHGLYTKSALALLKPGTKIDLVDISETSLSLARMLIGSSAINYHLADILKWRTTEKYDFISIAEVIEHIENPEAMLGRVKELLRPEGAVFLSTPVNAPMIDHIYLFNNVGEIRALLNECGFRITSEKVVMSEDVSEADAIRNKLPIMFAGFLEHS